MRTILVFQCELVPDLFVYGARDADTAGVGEALEARGDVDAVAVDLLAIHHHVAEVDPNAKLHPPVGWQICVLGRKRGPDLNRALDGIHYAGELGQYAIARRVHESPAVLLDQRIDLFAMRGQGAKGRLLVLPHKVCARRTRRKTLRPPDFRGGISRQSSVFAEFLQQGLSVLQIGGAEVN